MPASPVPQQELASFGRRALKTAADLLLPRRVLAFHGPRNRRRIALTIDDGPSALTPAYLDVLDAYGVKATFFLLGCCCALRPSGVLEIARRGHELGCHGYTHRGFSGLPRDELLGELGNTASLMPEPRGLSLLRPPKGTLSPQAFLTCVAAGYTIVLWSNDSQDCRSQDPVRIQRQIAQNGVQNGDILLFHEGQRWTLEALPGVLRQLGEEGHELVTISELLRG